VKKKKEVKAEKKPEEVTPERKVEEKAVVEAAKEATKPVSEEAEVAEIFKARGAGVAAAPKAEPPEGGEYELACPACGLPAREGWFLCPKCKAILKGAT
jgi:outer membrane biosynthesis protein TonB